MQCCKLVIIFVQILVSVVFNVASVDVGEVGDHHAVERLASRLEQLELLVFQQREVNAKQERAIEHLGLEMVSQMDINRNLQTVIQKKERELQNLRKYVADITQGNAMGVDGNTDEEGISSTQGRTNKDNGGSVLKKTIAIDGMQRGIRQSEYVAFTAYLDHTIEHIGIDQPVIFDKVLLNEGSAYNIHTGMFVAPTDGLYVFNFVVTTTNVHQIVAKLVVDGVNQLDGISDTFHQNQEAQGGNFMILSVQKGQSVNVAAYRWADVSIDSSNTYRFGSFSGFRLY